MLFKARDIPPFAINGHFQTSFVVLSALSDALFTSLSHYFSPYQYECRTVIRQDGFMVAPAENTPKDTVLMLELNFRLREYSLGFVLAAHVLHLVFERQLLRLFAGL